MTDVIAVPPALGGTALNGGVSWVTGTTRGTVASFNGTSGAIATSGPVLATKGSFSVSGWAYLTKTGTWGDVITQDGSSGSAFYLQPPISSPVS